MMVTHTSHIVFWSGSHLIQEESLLDVSLVLVSWICLTYHLEQSLLPSVDLQLRIY